MCQRHKSQTQTEFGAFLWIYTSVYFVVSNYKKGWTSCHCPPSHGSSFSKFYVELWSLFSSTSLLAALQGYPGNPREEQHQHQLSKASASADTFPKQSAGPGRVFVHRRHFLSRKFSLPEDDLAAGKSLASYKPQQGRLQNWYLPLDFYIKLLWLIQPVKLLNLVKP